MTRSLRESDLAAVQAVAAAAGRRFAEVGDPRIARCADDPPPPLEALEAWRAAGRGWVACDEGGAVVGFVVVDLVDGCAHVEEVSVDPAHGGAGHGSALLEAVVRWAAAEGIPAVTLTTFAEVPWNRPYYERRGWRVVPPEAWTPGLAARVADEAAHGLDPELRVVMRREVGGVS